MIARCTTVRKDVARDLDFLILLVGSTGLPKDLKETISRRLLGIFAHLERLATPPSEAERLEIESMFVPMGGEGEPLVLVQRAPTIDELEEKVALMTNDEIKEALLFIREKQRREVQ